VHEVSARTRILGLVEGEPTTALSGVADRLFTALDRRYEVVGRLDYSPHGRERMALAARTFRPSRIAWRAHFHTSLTAYRTLTRLLEARLAEGTPEFDLALQVHGWVGRQPRPYALFVDQTRLMAERGWPGWLALSRAERPELLARERAMYRDAQHVFAMGMPARESIADDYGIDPSRVSVVGGGLSFDSPPQPAELCDRPSILFVGRDFERKGGEVLLQAFAEIRGRLPDASLHIVGARTRRRLTGVIWHGQIWDRERLAGLYRGARVFCQPSLYEPYGLAFIEAMAHGIPCVGTDVQSIPEILDGGRAGVLVPPNDPDGLAEAVHRLLTSDEPARSLAEAGPRLVASRHTWDAVVNRMAPAIGAAAPA
jgi:glycosyltransferase involved in cell wall biosynthesis